LTRKLLKTQVKFGQKIAPWGRFCGKSLQKSLLAGISQGNFGFPPALRP
jgi:hypothetical protein